MDRRTVINYVTRRYRTSTIPSRSSAPPRRTWTIIDAEGINDWRGLVFNTPPLQPNRGGTMTSSFGH